MLRCLALPSVGTRRKDETQKEGRCWFAEVIMSDGIEGGLKLPDSASPSAPRPSRLLAYIFNIQRLSAFSPRYYL